ncbi:recombinase A [Komagataeibacter saccharivorans NRIC 0614]|nr:recombinase A [Komagataeibacter saccharivorans NRIC 0614]
MRGCDSHGIRLRILTRKRKRIWATGAKCNLNPVFPCVCAMAAIRQPAGYGRGRPDCGTVPVMVARSSRSAPRPLPPAPDGAVLRAVALAYLARFSATRAAVEQTLVRHVDRWVRRAIASGMEVDAASQAVMPARELIPGIVADMEGLGAVDDARFSEFRARSLARAGRSRRMVAAHLGARGVDEATAGQAMEEALGARDGEGRETELAAALVFVRKRRAGPFLRPDADEDEAAQRYRRAMDAMARAGFARDTARQALDMDVSEAEDRIMRMRSA